MKNISNALLEGQRYLFSDQISKNTKKRASESKFQQKMFVPI